MVDVARELAEWARHELDGVGIDLDRRDARGPVRERGQNVAAAAGPDNAHAARMEDLVADAGDVPEQMLELLWIAGVVRDRCSG